MEVVVVGRRDDGGELDLSRNVLKVIEVGKIKPGFSFRLNKEKNY